MSYTIEFNEERHEYRVNGIIKPSVSKVIKRVLEASEEEPPIFARLAMCRGTYAHKALQLLGLGQLDESSLLDEIETEWGVVKTNIKGYLDSYKKFADEEKFIPNTQEIMGYDPENDVCGTIDTIGTKGGEPWIVDYKTGSIYPKYAWQLTGYKSMIVHMIGLDRQPEFLYHKIGALQLFKDGKKGKMHEYHWGDHRQGWDSICTVYKILTGG